MENNIIGIVSGGPMIMNEWVITIEDIPGGHRLIARRGSDVQQMDIPNGVDAPIPDIQVSDADHGHDVTITVGDSAQTFHIHDGQDAPIPDIAVEAVEGGHKVTVTVGETVKSFVVLDGEDGADAPIPKVTVSTITGGHRVTISVGGTVQSFDVLDGKDGKDAINPTIAITEIEGGHRVTITTGSTVQSFDVMDGKDGTGSGGTVEVDPTLSVEGMAADAAATGAAVAPIAAITENTNSNAITWDGNPEGREKVAVLADEGLYMVHVSDYAPDVSVFTQEGWSVVMVSPDEGEQKMEATKDVAADATPMIAEGAYMLGENFGMLIQQDNTVLPTDFGYDLVFPKKGIYFEWFEGDGVYAAKLTSPLMQVPTTKVKKEALPDDIGGGTVDPTLSVPGAAADAAAIGNKLVSMSMQFADYVPTRPHMYYADGSLILPTTTVEGFSATETMFGDTVYTAPIPDGVEFYTGQSLKVFFDEQEYLVSITYEDGLWSCGNIMGVFGFVPVSEGDVPFAITNLVTGEMTFVALLSDAASHTIAIREMFGVGRSLVFPSATPGSSKYFRLAITDDGTVSAVEVDVTAD